ncbi:L-histidine N(alpha)-methyltransferase [Phycicoccus sp. MAQZ13P-2]|uniref:L-histidine N(alpha)-methyltransferase n=1 Tax=Phycicoccus mangrovi TaxID=2840470 RepID=UPI001C00622F|nr:L-histidine N(alpha)-methyltransferase [Phycicoccus mangrovi]MBT9255612.1 L-histidine N(alpha)-methyltransferase [Phycicoccus mangrovi]MBT9275326.1 L-histidine N(alpha)-methyltransferase [Phycicoccus mangrovi]
MSGVVEPRVQVLLDPDWASGSLVDDVRRGLGGRPRRLPPKWLYDPVGADLFDEITRLPEYYPTEAERAILTAHAAEIAQVCDASTLVELGSGTSDKTRTLLDAFRSEDRSHGPLARFVPVDVSDGTLREAASMLSVRYPGMAVEAVVGDFTLHLGQLPRGDRRMVAFLGSTIGNFYLEERAAFLGALADSLDTGEWLLLGTDLVKDADRLVAAYDDSAGVTERFIRNCLLVVNRELGADFDPGAFSYVPFWDPRMERIDMRLRAEEPQVVTVPGADLVVELATGEEICVEISTKFRREGIAAELGDAGFTVERTWTDDAGDFALTLARRD